MVANLVAQFPANRTFVWGKSGPKPGDHLAKYVANRISAAPHPEALGAFGHFEDRPCGQSRRGELNAGPVASMLVNSNQLRRTFLVRFPIDFYSTGTREERVANPQFAQIQVLEKNIAAVLLGKPDAVRLAIIALLAEGHILIEDAPGVGKTMLAKALARSLDCQFKRMQFTPDLLPSDILGSSIFYPNRSEFEFHPGPIFTNILLADEINRTPPRTQSALLEAMNEGQISVDGKTYRLDPPFFVIATQNPYEFEGTYPLPENQLDRFMLCIEVGYPERSVERQVLIAHRNGEPVDQLQPVLTVNQLKELQQSVRQVRIDDAISDYLLEIVDRTRRHADVSLGVSTRGALTMYRAVQGMAFFEGRDYAIPDDVKRLALPVLAHRTICRGPMRFGQRGRAQAILQQILQQAPAPR